MISRLSMCCRLHGWALGILGSKFGSRQGVPTSSPEILSRTRLSHARPHLQAAFQYDYVYIAVVGQVIHPAYLLDHNEYTPMDVKFVVH